MAAPRTRAQFRFVPSHARSALRALVRFSPPPSRSPAPPRNVPGGFYQDETPEELGTKLHLPPWYEDQRDAIVSQLEPITVPEENQPKPGTTSRPTPVAADAKAAVPLSTYKAAFDKK